MTRPRALLWLRAELKPGEERALITPLVARKLVDAGYELVVESCPQRAFGIEDYRAAGCRIAEREAWKQAPNEAIVLGLKELGAQHGPFRHRHVHFAHVYKQQVGWQRVLKAFGEGGGILYDLEYLVDDNGSRVAAFGYWAGFIGAALAVLALTDLDQHDLQAWPDSKALIADVQRRLETLQSSPTVLIIGALGRSGRGAVDLCQACGIDPTRWDLEETRAGGPFEALLQHDILVNCVFIDRELPPFTHAEHLQTPGRRLSVIADVSCDPDGIYNPLPIYTSATSLKDPINRVIDSSAERPSLDLIAIDHLPSLLPTESSESFSDQMLPHLLDIDQLDTGVWSRAYALFEKKRHEARGLENCS